ncbi:ATP-binding protein [Reinekea sp.]|jgi:PAS domain S-box-containing protein|uniref:ATP-binding protein n=1 Tax=Reinekea sp. TaxID=1970455 RepID=UPI002A7F58C7|nr:ATP-binding protein [Reinekea sp.]
MIQFRSLSHRLFFGYAIAALAMIGLLVVFDQVTVVSLLLRLLVSLILVSLVFLVLHLFFYRHFLRPLKHLMLITKQLAHSSTSLIRAHKLQDDELGDLVDAFNEMLDQIQLREEMIVSERDRVAIALEQADDYARVTLVTNKKLENEVQVRTRAEAKLTEFQQFLTSIINSMPSALISIDPQFIVTQWNDEASELSGTDSATAIGSQVQDAFPMIAQHIEWIEQVWRQQQPRTLHNIEQTVQHQIRHFDIIVYPLKDTNEPSAVIRIDDITDKFLMEEAIIQSEKVMSLGGMAAGMAHEINNPVSAIVQNIQNIKRRIAPELAINQVQATKSGISLDHLNHYLGERKILAFLNNISESGLRASNLVTNMLQFSRENSVNLQPCLIIDVLEKAINIAITDDQLSDFKDNFDLNFDQDFAAPQARVPGVFTELEQVLLNLIKNAVFAINDRMLSLNDIDEGIIHIHQYIRDNQCIISVGDNGIGMGAQTRKKIFEPFFTTKEVGTGTGLGLSVSYFIICSHHRGQMQVESEFGHGSRFEISLPLYNEV